MYSINMGVSYNKLVRDKIPQILDKKGVTYRMRVAGDREYRKELVRKLVEEVREFKKDLSIEELADVLEVIKAIKNLPEYVNVEAVRKIKNAERGRFKKRLILSGEKG